MMWCVVCHFIRLHEHDGQGIHKGLVSYNTNHGISALKNMFNLNIQIYITNGGPFCCTRLQKPEVTNKAQRREKMFTLLRSPNSLVTNAFITN
jgi:hypothetical protein